MSHTTSIVQIEGYAVREVRAFRRLHLASGARSDVYVEASYHVLAEAMPLVGRAFICKMRAQGWQPEAVGGLNRRG